MRLTPTERDRLLLFGAAELARARRARGLRLNVPEATALIADMVCEAARDGARLAEAIERARAVLGPDDVLPGVADVVTEVHVEAVFDDGSRLAVVSDPIAGGSGPAPPGARGPRPGRAEPQPAPRRTGSPCPRGRPCGSGRGGAPRSGWCRSGASGSPSGSPGSSTGRWTRRAPRRRP